MGGPRIKKKKKKKRGRGEIGERKKQRERERDEGKKATATTFFLNELRSAGKKKLCLKEKVGRTGRFF